MTHETEKGLAALADEIAALAAKATNGDLTTAQRHVPLETVECPFCGDGEIDASDYCNFDGKALGVQFYGIGEEFGAHERLWTKIIANLDTIIAALRTTPLPDGGDVEAVAPYPGLPMSDADLDKHYAASKVDVVGLVGSEVRQIIGELKHWRRAALAALHNRATAGEAMAWLHVMHMEGGQTYERLLDHDGTDEYEPTRTGFGLPGRDYSESYPVTVTPLYATPPAPKDGEVERALRMQEALTPYGETKAAYMGEFSWTEWLTDEDGLEQGHQRTVPWTTIKEIMAAIRQRAGVEKLDESDCHAILNEREG